MANLIFALHLMQQMQREQAELDQKTVERLRAVLTIEQRGLFAMM